MNRYGIAYTQISVRLDFQKLYSNCVIYDGAKVHLVVRYVVSIYTE